MGTWTPRWLPGKINNATLSCDGDRGKGNVNFRVTTLGHNQRIFCDIIMDGVIFSGLRKYLSGKFLFFTCHHLYILFSLVYTFG